ncbi:bacterio-opsin activator domain-containing protein [Halobium salinum]|uniref:Bacterio-opsin activator domain-containing protein n=1 Tax=Halobium salinum TaxID=1364940 RepID=A0ABD5P6N5_9EURY|nr:bacterio-opsin activator domain-containing protein [Halobium salinum]
MSSEIYIIYVVESASVDSDRSTVARLESALGPALVERVVVDRATPERVRELLDGVGSDTDGNGDDDAGTDGGSEVPPGDVGAVVVEFGADAAVGREWTSALTAGPDVPTVLFGPWSDPTTDAVVGTSAVEFVQRKNAASVGVLARTLRNRLGLEPDAATDAREESGARGETEVDGATGRLEETETPAEPPGPPTTSQSAEATAADRTERDAELRRYEAMMATVGDGVYALDADDRFVAVNEAYLDLTGYSREELLGAHAETVTGAAMAADIDRMRRDLADGTEEAVTLRTDLPTRDGGTVPIEARVTRFPLENGEYGRVGVVRDVRERDRLEAELEAVLERITDAFFALDEEWRFTFVNDRAERLLEADESELLGESVWDTFEAAVDTAFQREYERAMETQEPVTFEAYYPPLETWFEVNAYPSDTGLSVYFRDVTDRKRAEERLEYERSLNRSVVENARTGIVVVDEEMAVVQMNDRAMELLEVSEADVERFPDVRPEYRIYHEGEPVTGENHPLRRTLETEEPVTTSELELRYPDGRRKWIAFRGSTFVMSDGERYAVGMFEETTAVRKRATRLESLTAWARQLPEAETVEAVHRTVVEAATEVLDAPYAYVAVDSGSGSGLEVGAATEGLSTVVDDPLLGPVGESPVWEAFIRDESTVVDLGGGSGSAVVRSLGSHGVFVAVDPESDEFDDADWRLVEVLGATARAALDRAARESDLRAHRDDLAEKNERLDRLNRVNRAIRDITGVLLGADSHEAIERGVCERLVDIEPYTFAWVGHVDRAAKAVEPAASAGAGAGYLDDVTIPLDDAARVGPAARAVETGEPQVQPDILSAAAFEPWREAALSRGFRSCVTVPIRYRDTLHGVLTLYADTPDVFDPMETAVLAELGETIGYAMNALDRKRALVGERSTELRFDVPTTETPLFGFLTGTAGRFTLENTVHRTDGFTHLFFRASGVDAETVRREAEASTAVERVDVISETDDGCLFECTVGESAVVSDLLERGALLDTVDVSDRRATVTVRVPTSTDVRGFITYFEDAFGDVTLLARRELDESVMSRREFEDGVRDRLTDRQEEVLRTAYYAGFFEWPREKNGQDVAEMLGVTQPTVNRHIRASERTLLEVLFGERGSLRGTD